jgi:hypothetical protein
MRVHPLRRPPRRRSVRCRTDGERQVAQTQIKSRGAAHGMSLVPCRVGWPSRSKQASDGVSASPRRKPRQPTIGKPINEEVRAMLYTIAVVLLILWVFGLVSAYTMGGFIHILLVIAVVMVLVNLISGRRSL